MRLPDLVAVSFRAATWPNSVTRAPWPRPASSAVEVTPSDSATPSKRASGWPET